jgi:hypothetical protein
MISPHATLLLMRWTWSFFLIACTAVTWNDTFTATGTRDTEDAGPPPEGGSPQACANLAASQAVPSLTAVTFPGHGGATETIHIVVGSQSCDLHVDTDTDGVVFVSDASPCAPLIAPGAPGQSSATVTGTTSPTLLVFQWAYTQFCTIDDAYALEKK